MLAVPARLGVRVRQDEKYFDDYAKKTYNDKKLRMLKHVAKKEEDGQHT